jgi:UDP-3-O-[3-hydroxymyristoyl] glucosamine N-acyltransferase
MQSLPLSAVASLTGADLAAGADPAANVSGVASLQEAQPGDITFFGNAKYLPALRRTRATAALVPRDFAEELPVVLLRVDDPSLAFAQVVAHFTPPPVTFAPGIHPTAVVAPSAEIDPSASVQPYAVIEDGVRIGAGTVVGAHTYIGHESRIGEQCHLHAHVTLRERTQLGARVIIHSGAVLGSDGFGFSQQQGRHVKIPQVGYVQVDDDVEIGACTTIDRARFGRTWIQAGTKIDNLVQIAHNVVLGEHCLVASQTGISGSARFGRYVTMAGQVGVVGHVEVGDHVLVMAKSGISKDTPAHTTLLGMIGAPIKEERELMVHYRRLPKTVARLKQLEGEVAALRALVEQKNAAPGSEGA